MSTTSDIVRNLKDLLASGLYSHLTISCEGKDSKVHKLVLHTASPIFSNLPKWEVQGICTRLSSAPYPHSYTEMPQEAQENHAVIELEDEVDALQALIHYLYHFTYNDSFVESTMSFAVRVYAIADKYQVPQLQSLAAKRFKTLCDPTTDLDDFVNSITLVEDCTSPNDNTLREIVFPAIENNITLLLESEKSRILILEMPDLTIKVLSRLDRSNTKAFPPLRYTTSEGDSGNETYTNRRGRRLG